MSDVNISKYRAQVIRQGSTPASPGFAVAEGQNPVDPSGSGQTHLPVTIATASTGLSITESQILSGAGLVSQYIRGDGSLADFPATTGGGSSVSYYLNGSVSQGTIGGVAYKQLNRTPVFGAGTDFTIAADGYIASFITDASDPNKLLIPAGNWNFETYFSASSSGGSPSFYVELYKYDGTTFTLIATSSSAPELIAFGTNLNPYFSTLAVPETVLALTDRLAIRYYVTHSGRTITLHTEDNHLCQIITTFTTGLTALNGLTAQVQNFAVGTSGTDFAISSATATHTFNLPTASATNRGALSSADWTTFNNKTSNLGTVTSVGLSSATSGVTIGSTPVTTSGTITLAIATASGSLNGLLSSTDWTTFNNKASTAALAAYLPLAGGTLTGALNGTSAVFSSSVDARGNIAMQYDGTAANQAILSHNGTSAILYSSGNTTKKDFTIYRDGGVDVGLIIKGSNGNVLIGTTTDNGAKLQVSGTATISSALTSSDLTIKNSANAETLDLFLSPSTFNGFIDYPSSRSLIIRNKGSLGGLTLASTGAATFSSSVTAKGTGNYNGFIADNSSSSTIGGGYYAANSFGVQRGIFGVAGAISGTTDNNIGIFAEGGLGIKFFVNGSGTASHIMTSGGNVGIGTTSPSYTLSVSKNIDDWIGQFKNYGSNAYGLQIDLSGSTGATGGYVLGAYSQTGTGFFLTNAGNVLIGTTTSGSSKLRMVGLPTSAAGLSSGDVYSLAGTLMIA